MTCAHQRYKGSDYMSDEKALKAIRAKDNTICHMGIVVTRCEDCNADISHARRVKVKTVREII